MNIIEKMTITKDQLYDAAFKYKKTGIWKKLWDNEIFAVRLNNGETGYICTMGKDSGLNALGVFIGDEGYLLKESFLSRRKGRKFGHLPERMAYGWQVRTHSRIC